MKSRSLVKALLIRLRYQETTPLIKRKLYGRTDIDKLIWIKMQFNKVIQMS